MDNIFPTYYDINEYGEAGCINFHRVIASSYPLILWSPAIRIIEKYFLQGKCRLSPETIIHYIENGYVRIITRDNWLDKKYRENHLWEGAKWIDKYDDAISSICTNDSVLPESERRVRIVPDEDGTSWALEFLDENPNIIDSIWPYIVNKSLPQSFNEQVYKHLDSNNKRNAVTEVLRDARNQTRAIELSNAELPFLSNDEIKFYRLLEGIKVISFSDNHKYTTKEFTKAIEIPYSITELLKFIDQLQSYKTVNDFVGSKEHRELAKFVSKIASIARLIEINELENFIIDFIPNEIIQNIDQGLVSNSFVEKIGFSNKPFLLYAQLSSWLFTVLTVLFDKNSILGLFGLGINIIPMFYGFLQRLGLVKIDYNGPQWTFMYCYGERSPSQEQIKIIKRALREFNYKL